jgi:hypothetical protein
MLQWILYNTNGDFNFVNINTLMHIFFEKNCDGKFYAMGTMLNGEDIVLTHSYETKEECVNFIKEIFK